MRKKGTGTTKETQCTKYKGYRRLSGEREAFPCPRGQDMVATRVYGSQEPMARHHRGSLAASGLQPGCSEACRSRNHPAGQPSPWMESSGALLWSAAPSCSKRMEKGSGQLLGKQSIYLFNSLASASPLFSPPIPSLPFLYALAQPTPPP